MNTYEICTLNFNSYRTLISCHQEEEKRQYIQDLEKSFQNTSICHYQLFKGILVLYI